MKIEKRWVVIVIGVILSLNLPVAGAYINIPEKNETHLKPDASPIAKTFYLHSLNKSVSVGGYTTLTIFNTTLGTNLQMISSSKRLIARWFLYPEVPADVVFQGDAIINLWGTVDTLSNHPLMTVTIYRIDQSGARTQISTNSKNIDLTNLWELKSLSVPLSTLLPRNSSLEVQCEINGDAARTYSIAWGSTARNSSVVLPAAGYISVKGIETMDYTHKVRVFFLPNALNRTIYISARITDPFGGYDIRWVNLTLRDPGGVDILTNASMKRVSGYFNSYESVFEISWNYTGRPPGVYNVTVYAIDNNGYYAFLANPSDRGFGGHLVRGWFSFTIGAFPYYVNILAVDSKKVPLANTSIYAEVGGIVINQNRTDLQGIANLSLYASTYTLTVIWQGVNVSALTYQVTGNVSRSNPVVIVCEIYYPLFVVRDSHGAPVRSASVFVQHPNGSIIPVPYRTNSSGMFSIPQTPAGGYLLTVYWLGSLVAKNLTYVSGNRTYIISTEIFYLGVTVLDSGGVPLSKAEVIVRNNTTRLVMDSQLTSISGQSTSVLPAGLYDLQVRWYGLEVGLKQGVILTSDAQVTVSAWVFYLDLKVVDSHDNPVQNATVTLTSETTGGLISSNITGSSGGVSLRSPADSVRITVIYFGIQVYDERFYQVTGNASKVLKAEIFYLDVKVVDSRGSVLPDAVVTFTITSRIVATGRTNASGMMHAILPKAKVEIVVRWMNALVNVTQYSVVSDAAITLNASVLYLKLRAVDTRGYPLVQARFEVTDTGTHMLISTSFSDNNGESTIRVPSGDHHIVVYYRSVPVNSTTHRSTSDGTLILKCRVYHLLIVPRDSKGVNVEGASVLIVNATERTMYDSGITNFSGIDLRAPAGDSRIIISWRGITVYDAIYTVMSDATVNPECSIFYLRVKVADSRGNGVEKATVTVRITPVIESILTDELGEGEIRLPGGSANLSVTWKGVEVARRGVQLTGDMSLTVDARVYYISMKAVDSRGKGIENLHVVILLGEESIESGITDEEGRVTVRLPGGEMHAEMRWYGVLVGDQSLTADRDKGVTLSPKIYYLDMRLIDSQGIPIEGASVTISSGEITRGGVTPPGGRIEERLPPGEYNISASWKRTLILTTKIQISSDLNRTCTADVVYLTVEVIDAYGSPLTSVYARVESTVTVDAGYTIDGKVVFRLPKGDYRIYIRYANTFYLTDIVYEPPPRSITLSNDERVTIKVDVYPIPIYMTNAFFLGILVMLLVILWVYILWRERKKKEKETQHEEKIEEEIPSSEEHEERGAEAEETKEGHPISKEEKCAEKSKVTVEKEEKGSDDARTDEVKKGGGKQ